MAPKLYLESVKDDHIYLMTEGRSVCELDRSDDYLIDTFSFLRLKPPVFWFARLKAFIEGEGEGTFLMEKLCKIVDEKQAYIVNVINPYGKMSRKDLIQFYEKFGFENHDDSIMVRRPIIKEKKDAKINNPTIST